MSITCMPRPRQRQDTNSGGLLSCLWSAWRGASGGGSRAGGGGGSGGGSELQSPQPHLRRLVSSGDCGGSDSEGFVPQVRAVSDWPRCEVAPATGLSAHPVDPDPVPAHRSRPGHFTRPRLQAAPWPRTARPAHAPMARALPHPYRLLYRPFLPMVSPPRPVAPLCLPSYRSNP